MCAWSIMQIAIHLRRNSNAPKRRVLKHDRLVKWPIAIQTNSCFTQPPYTDTISPNLLPIQVACWTMNRRVLASRVRQCSKPNTGNLYLTNPSTNIIHQRKVKQFPFSSDLVCMCWCVCVCCVVLYNFFWFLIFCLLIRNAPGLRRLPTTLL